MLSFQLRSARFTAAALCAGALVAPWARATSAPAAASGTDAALEAALSAINTDHIRSDIFFIASDEMGGRDTPSPGQRIAARYIRARLERMGFKPGAQNGFFYEYPLSMPKIDEKQTGASYERGGTKTELAFGKDYFFRASRLATIENNAGIEFCGRGKDDDFKPSVAGKWALVFDENQGTLAIEKAAQKAGAVGLIFTPRSDYSGKPYDERFAKDVLNSSKARVSWPASQNDNAPTPSVIYLQRAVAEKIAPLADLEKLANSAPRPAIEGTFSERRTLAGDNGMIKCEDVCGFWPGSDPALKSETIMISAHYDHVGTDSKGVIYNGADDNGSGTTGLLAMSEALAAHGPFRRSIMLMWVSGEEKGLWGSRAWTEHPWLPDGAKPVCDINMDMIGRNAPDYLLVTPTSALKEYNGLTRLAERLAPVEGFAPLGNADQYWRRSDQLNYADNLKIPVTFLFNGEHADYHQPTDDPDKIDCDKIRRVVRLVLRMVDELQADKLDL